MTKYYYLLTLVFYQFITLHAQPTLVHFTTGSTSSSYGNSAPFRYGDKIYFTSICQKKKPISPVSRLYSKEDNKAGTVLLDINPVKGDIHASNMTFSPDGKTIFYTLCLDETQDKCTIWSRKKSYEGGWEPASKLPDVINLRGFTATQPNIGYNWRQKKYALYFVSDRPGGAGGKDLWYSTMEMDGSYGQPVHLPFNTDKDEVTPFYHMGEKTLFFSSNGLTGFGGFDIYSTEMDSKGKWEEPMNQGTILNSKFDETYFTFHANVKKGYFVSNRNISANHKNYLEKGDTHIYEIGPGVELGILVSNIHNNTAIYGATAIVYDEITDQKFVFKEKPFDTNLTVSLFPDRTYRIVILKEGYLPSTIETSTEGIVFPISLKQEVQLFVDEEFTNANRETYFEAPAPQQVEENGFVPVQKGIPPKGTKIKELNQQK